MVLTFDLGILEFIQNNLRSIGMDHLMTFVSWLGNNSLIWIAITIILIIWPKTRKIGFMCAGALLLSLIFCNLILKPWVARLRPFEGIEGLKLLILPPLDFSFPSGHSSSSFAAAFVLAKLNKKIGISAFTLAALIAFSRLYLYVHYPTDVFFGIILGLLCGALSVYGVNLVYKKAFNKN